MRNTVLRQEPKMIKQPTLFFATSDLAVVGSNPENADYTNPRGEYYGEVAKVVAENDYGDRCYLTVVTSHDKYGPACMAAAEKLAERLNARLAAGRLPVAFDTWIETRPAYASRAYQDYGADDDIAWERDLG